MFHDLLLPISALIALTLWLGLKYAIAAAQMQRQIEIARRGAASQGKVVAIQRPFMFDACTRLYFDFVPEGADHPVRVCHVDRRALADVRSALPIAGAVVAVRYLPERPRCAVIARLIVR